MVKKLLIVGAFLWTGLQSHAQEHEISAGMGLGSTTQILDEFLSFGSAFSAVFFNTSYLDKTKNLGEFRLAYAYTPKEKWHFGVAFSYNRSEFDALKSGEKLGEQTNTYYTAAGEATFSFLKKESLRLYVLWGAGATFGSAKKTKYANENIVRSHGTMFNFQITPIGISYGKQWGGFAEFGFGYRGLLSFGVFHSLK